MTSVSSARDRILAAAGSMSGGDALPTFAAIASAAGVSRATVHRHFRTRSELLALLNLEPDTAARERILQGAVELLSRQGLARMSMDELAEASGVSRATLYRIFPGKTALLKELVAIYSPVEVVARVMAEADDRPPEEVIPALAGAIALHLKDHVGLVRVLLTEVTGSGPEAEAVRAYGADRAIAPLVQYLAAQMAAGRLRLMHPLLALQMLAGPLVAHLLTRSIAEELLGFREPVEEVAAEFAAAWVRAMSPAGSG